MDTFDVRRLALILAIQAEIEGMKASNKQRKIDGKSLLFTYNAFEDKARELRDLAYSHNDQLF